MQKKVLKDAALEVIDQEGEDNPLVVAIGSRGERQILNPEALISLYPSPYNGLAILMATERWTTSLILGKRIRGAFCF